ncbi:hornerin-like [Iris pallida]|uniref:Hornerin-like n=1 Tax=Iris pallida TaxID=29817 RepID=A0AAX6FVW7_IRIPA|nr:hornerin-like [Iris pallida]
MPSGPLGLAATPGFFFPLGVLPPPLFPSRRLPGWPGPSWPGGSPPCGLSQSFPPPLNPPRRRRPRRCHRARRRAAGPDPPPSEVPLPAPPPPLGPPPGRSRASVDPLRPASPLLRLRCRGLRPPLSQLPRSRLLPRWRPPSPSFSSLPWTKPNFQAAPDGSEVSPASVRLAPPASQGPEAPSWAAVAASQPSVQWPSGSFSSVQSSPSASIDGPAALFSASLARWPSAHPSSAPLGALPPVFVACWPRGSVLRVSAPSTALADPPSSSGLWRSPSDLAGGPISPLTGLGAAGRLLAGCSPPSPLPFSFSPWVGPPRLRSEPSPASCPLHRRSSLRWCSPSLRRA